MFDLTIIAFQRVYVALACPLLCIVRLNLTGPVIACEGTGCNEPEIKVMIDLVKLDLKVNEKNEHIHSTAKHTE
jgi:hypothetical protein